jgi:protoporphyrinogen oxidase
VVARSARPIVVFEADQQVGVLARTVVRDGYRFNLGGDRVQDWIEGPVEVPAREDG